MGAPGAILDVFPGVNNGPGPNGFDGDGFHPALLLQLAGLFHLESLAAKFECPAIFRHGTHQVIGRAVG